MAIQQLEIPGSMMIAKTHSKIGCVLHDQGKGEEAVREYRKAAAIQEQKAPGSLALAVTYNGIGLVLQDEGDMVGAFQEYEKAMAIEDAKDATDLPSRVSCNFKARPIFYDMQNRQHTTTYFLSWPDISLPSKQ